MLPSLLISAMIALVPGAFTAPTEFELGFGGPSSLESRQGGYYWSDWSENGIKHSCVNGAGGSYTATWSGTGGFVCGKGWSPGGSRLVGPFPLEATQGLGTPGR